MTEAKFVWYDLNSKQPAQAKKFYTALFGWNVMPWKPDDAPADAPAYDMIAIGEQAIGGVNELPSDTPAPSHWMGHVQVDDVDSAMKRAEGMGAKFPMGAHVIPSVGKMAIMIDPDGCVCSLFTPEGAMPPGPTQDTHGMVGWNELMAKDADAAKVFYSEVVGWKWRPGPFQDQMEYYMFGTGEAGGDAGGMAPTNEQMPVAAWTLYFTTTDLDATVAKIEELGGEVVGEPFAVPTVGKFAFGRAPDGSMFGTAQWELPES